MGDLYRPLGLDKQHGKERRFVVPTGRLLRLSVVFAVLVGSFAVSLHRPPLRDVDVFAEAALREADEARAAEMAAAKPDPVASAPLMPLGRSSLGIETPVASDDAPTVSYPPGASGTFGKLVSVRDPAVLRQPLSEASSPDEALLEPGDEGPLPVRAADGRRPFDVYQTEPSADRGTRVAIVVGGLGISQTGTMNAIDKLPAGVTLAFAPAGNSLDRWMRQARSSGHELLLQVPMEPIGYPDVSPGEHTLTLADAEAGRWRDLQYSLGRLTNYVGITNYMGARLTGDAGAMRSLASELAKRGLLYLDDGTSARSLARDALGQAGGLYAGADIVIDQRQDAESIAKQLDALERIARAKGRAIGVASAFDNSVSAIAAWIGEAEARGIAVVPVSALADDPEAQ
ncbi:divergent polysaccharide deacetylase family protein [Aureimonas psammosilenae]|uniref:divergent polysaccharide deacetylase family protein n=1 Tax=Aureimonas psammosilenae TaxID=2495496 RepID=UPI00126132BF|nr:divergent polysaccharide deacetylase family protein [Aureimonas psammosilenae]